MPIDSIHRHIDILLIEDSPTDVLISQEALGQAKVLNTLHIVEDGVEAMRYLYREGQYTDAPLPDLIILDLNLPRKNGREVLAEIKADSKLKIIPIVILTTSRAEGDVLKAYGAHANCYVVKPFDFNSFVQIVQSIHQFWFSVVTLPSEVQYEQTPDSHSVVGR